MVCLCVSVRVTTYTDFGRCNHLLCACKAIVLISMRVGLALMHGCYTAVDAHCEVRLPATWAGMVADRRTFPCK